VVGDPVETVLGEQLTVIVVLSGFESEKLVCAVSVIVFPFESGRLVCVAVT
jgi:hypothetical protein